MIKIQKMKVSTILSSVVLVGVTEAQTRISGGASGSLRTTRYWDCCKPSCGWNGKGPLTRPVNSCNAAGSVVGVDTTSGCNGGSAFMCQNQVPWASGNIAYGFVAGNVAGRNEQSLCCSCFELTFTSGAASGKKMYVQMTNTGSDLGSNHFDIAIPGGGFGIFDGCTKQFPSTPSGNWGARYGGVSNRAACSGLPSSLVAGCQWRFDWFGGSDNPSASFVEVTCPSALTSRSGCSRK